MGCHLTPHFSIDELTVTKTGLPNDAPLAVAGNLLRLCQLVLEPARELAGPLRITSAYRSPAVNARVGGASKSAHMDGRAADIQAVKVSDAVLFDLIRHSDIPFDQLILEPGWVHVAVARMGETPREQVLKARREAGRIVYEVAK